MRMLDVILDLGIAILLLYLLSPFLAFAIVVIKRALKS